MVTHSNINQTHICCNDILFMTNLANVIEKKLDTDELNRLIEELSLSEYKNAENSFGGPSNQTTCYFMRAFEESSAKTVKLVNPSIKSTASEVIISNNILNFVNKEHETNLFQAEQKMFSLPDSEQDKLYEVYKNDPFFELSELRK